jgi:hypothetical protein
MATANTGASSPANLVDRILANMVTGPSGDKARAEHNTSEKQKPRKRKGDKNSDKNSGQKAPKSAKANLGHSPAAPVGDRLTQVQQQVQSVAAPIGIVTNTSAVANSETQVCSEKQKDADSGPPNSPSLSHVSPSEDNIAYDAAGNCISGSKPPASAQPEDPLV